MRASPSALVTAVAVVLAAATAGAQEREEGFDRPYFAAKLMFATGGEVEIDLDADITSSASLSVTDDARPTYGVGFSYMHPVLGFFALGGQITASTWITSAAQDAGSSRNFYADLSFVPQVNIDFANVEVYASASFGPSLDFVGDDDLRAAVIATLQSRAEVGTALGYHLGLVVGARVALQSDWGLVVEFGYAQHRFWHPVEFQHLAIAGSAATLVTAETELEIMLDQVALNAGVYF